MKNQTNQFIPETDNGVFHNTRLNFVCVGDFLFGGIMSQEKQIAEYLKQGNTITPLEALRLFKCWALSSRIAELNKRGYAIQSKMVKVGKKRVAQYSLNTGV